MTHTLVLPGGAETDRILLPRRIVSYQAKLNPSAKGCRTDSQKRPWSVLTETVQKVFMYRKSIAEKPGWHRIGMSTVSVRSYVRLFSESMDKYGQDTAEIARCGIRWREFGRFIHSPKALPVTGMEFIEELRGTLGDHLTGHNMDNIIFTIIGRMEIRI